MSLFNPAVVELDVVRRRHQASPSLTAREREVLDCLLTGASEKEVAAALAISPQTVHAHVKSLYRGYGVSSRPQLMAKFLGDAMRALRSGRDAPLALSRCVCGR
ncbi:MAG: helix-turn-helix domain-containing protein [Myxococcaceae bacterium]